MMEKARGVGLEKRVRLFSSVQLAGELAHRADHTLRAALKLDNHRAGRIGELKKVSPWLWMADMLGTETCATSAILPRLTISPAVLLVRTE